MRQFVCVYSHDVLGYYGGPRKHPVILIVDGHSSRLDVETMWQAAVNQVCIVALPSHLTHLLQPNDAGVNKSVKSLLGKHGLDQLHEFDLDVNMTDVACIVVKALNDPSLRKTIVNSFRSCGVWPLNKSAVETLIRRESVSMDVQSDPHVQGAVELLKDYTDRYYAAAQAKLDQQKRTPKARRRPRLSTAHARLLSDAESISDLEADNIGHKANDLAVVPLFDYLTTDIGIDRSLLIKPNGKRATRVDMLSVLHEHLTNIAETRRQHWQSEIDRHRVPLPQMMLMPPRVEVLANLLDI